MNPVSAPEAHTHTEFNESSLPHLCLALLATQLPYLEIPALPRHYRVSDVVVQCLTVWVKASRRPSNTGVVLAYIGTKYAIFDDLFLPVSKWNFQLREVWLVSVVHLYIMVYRNFQISDLVERFCKP